MHVTIHIHTNKYTYPYTTKHKYKHIHKHIHNHINKHNYKLTLILQHARREQKTARPYDILKANTEEAHAGAKQERAEQAFRQGVEAMRKEAGAPLHKWAYILHAFADMHKGLDAAGALHRGQEEGAGRAPPG